MLIYYLLMAIVELVKSGTCDRYSDLDEINFSVLKSTINTFLLNSNIEVLSVNGPYANFFPPINENGPERVCYTANIVYTYKER